MENDLISRSEALALIKNEYLASLGVHDKKRASGFQGAYQLLYDLPAIDPESLRPVGQWEFPIFDDGDANDPRARCSVCGSTETPLARHRYCPNCGARMEGTE